MLESNNVIPTMVYFRWNLVAEDADDNKFTDAYIAGQADYLITTDAHFDPLKKMAYPKINVITPSIFLNVLRQLS